MSADTSSSTSFDDAVVGAGIVGLAHAFHLARRGRRVVVFERSPRACGASVRNFGMLWPIGQPSGAAHDMAQRSREFWTQILTSSGLWHAPVGSLHLAYERDELAVLEEFCTQAKSDGRVCAILSPAQIAARSPAVRTDGLLGALWSPSEICVDPRQVIAGLPGWLEQAFGVRFQFNTAATEYQAGKLAAGGRTWNARRLFVCGGDDFQTLFPQAFAGSGMVRCKLQMMRSAPYGDKFHLGPMLAAGSTLRHYKSFQDCPSLAAVRERFSRERPEFDQYGIHVMASQNGHGELILGDSHEYDDAITPFDRPEIDRLVLDYLNTFLDVPRLEIAGRWHGIYAKHPRETAFVSRLSPDVTIVTGLGGAGMTMSFGLADEVVNNTEEL